jgi:hypothetical protein
LERLDGRGVVVALDLERDSLAAAEVDDAGVLAGPLEDRFARAREPLQQRGRVLVAAMLGPEEREDPELDGVGLAAEQLDDAPELPVREPERPVKRLLGDLRQRVECTVGP